MESIVGGVCPWAAGGQAELVLGGFIQLLLSSYCGMNSPNMWPKDKASSFLNETIPEYDFIVVGSGSSGSIIARRLAEDNWKVLLMEAGTNPPAESEVPAMAASIEQSMWNWDYKAEANPNYCQGMKDKKCRIPAARGFGGSSMMNRMLYLRGNKQDYDDWEKMGNLGWGYESIKQYFNKIENLQEVPNYENVKKDYGTNGPMNIDSFRGFVPWKEVVTHAWKDSGSRLKDHGNEVHQVGISEAFGTIYGGQRWSVAKGYMMDMDEKLENNLHIVRNALVTKILFDEKTKLATGVQFKITNKDLEVKMTKELIISAGTLNTPKLLMMSGIGPKQHLEKIGIKPIFADLPVGQNLIDHIAFPMLIKIENSLGVFSRDVIIKSVMQYLLHRTGPLATVGMTDLVGFINTQDEKSTIPDVEMLHIYTPINDTLTVPDFIYSQGFAKDFSQAVVNATQEHECIFVLPALLKPKSRGKIELQTNNPTEAPLLFMNYFKEQEDMATMLRAIKFVEKLEASKTFKEAGLKIKEIKLENCPFVFKSDDYWKCMVKQIANTLAHPVGTARMGPKNDGSSVVDPQLRVHGFKNLRVADASVMPDIIRGHTNAPTMVIGEKAADMIKQAWAEAKKDEL